MKTILLSILIGLVLTGCPTLKYIDGGFSGSGYASRYWDCCRPDCSYTQYAGNGNECKICDDKGNIISDKNAYSMCDYGPATTCISQSPFVESGCSTMGFAFAKVPGGGPLICGRCFELTFTGEGKYETQLNHKKLKGKKLVVMASNIGYDASENEFEILIPGGGDKLSNGCEQIFGTDLGSRFGGLLSDCENEVGWSVSNITIYSGRKQCLAQKCNSVFSSNITAKKGCLFHAEFLEAANFPLFTFKEVQCPTQLTTKYK